MGSHPFPLKDIALQAGVSLATVDRVVNQRGGVRANTVREVNRAIAELERQAGSIRLQGRRFVVDLVMQSPPRFSSAVARAFERVVPRTYPAQVRIRTHLEQRADDGLLVAALQRIRGRGSHGVILKAPDSPDVAREVARLHAAGIPCVTFVTDVADCPRIGYIGIDNRAAGRTAASLIGKVLGDRGGSVLVTLSSERFLGEQERESGFRDLWAMMSPQREVHALRDTDGLDESVRQRLLDTLTAHPDIVAVYSIGGGNRAITSELQRAGVTAHVLVAHDLDTDNLGLLRDGALDFVLHHNLESDADGALRLILAHHAALPKAGPHAPAAMQIVTRENIPS